MSKKQPEQYKRLLLIALEKTLGIVTPACQEVGISRDRFYKYYNEDPEFKRKVDELNQVTLDFVENQLLKKIKDGSEKSIMFYMRYKGKKRGYVDNLDITSGGDKIFQVIYVDKENNNDDESKGD